MGTSIIQNSTGMNLMYRSAVKRGTELMYGTAILFTVTALTAFIRKSGAKAQIAISWYAIIITCCPA
jgi:hypothetical protein